MNRVLVTGHTGFKGGWLCLWLKSMGAEVHGYALAPPSSPSLFETADIATAIDSSTLGDIRDYDALSRTMASVRPQVVFHLAAQSLVRSSYEHPVDTYATNVMGTVHLLEAVRAVSGVKAVVNVTSDKCYENREWAWGYRETEPMGGHDPYASSKGCAELVTAAYRRSFLGSAGVAVATARAGNVIGGGDWAEDRLVPDLLRAIDAGNTLIVRSPEATRPWQHVLEPIAGYVSLAEHLLSDGPAFADAWNFGPADDEAQTVRQVVDWVAGRTPALAWTVEASPQPHEAGYLKVDSSKARARLGWHPRWALADALGKTLDWHAAWRSGQTMRDVTVAQIAHYRSGGAAGDRVAV